MGQTVHPGRRARGFALLAAGSLAATPFLTGCSSSVAAAPTTLQGVLGASVVHTDGTTRTAVDGLTLRPGDVVRTGSAGRAELVTRNRVVYVGSQAAVQVVDGTHQVLRLGGVVADAQQGAPDLDIAVAGLDVHTPPGSAVRAERSVTSRIGALAGPVDVTTSAGRRLTIDALHQAMVGGDALPDSTTPLRLTDDDGEAHAVPDLVRDDETLNGLARGIDSTGPSTTRVVEASWSGPLTAPRGVDRSERLLPAVIAATGSAAGADQRYSRAVDYRKAGGSWGVIAHLLGVPAQNVVATLAAFERTQPPGQIGSVAAVLASVSAAGNGAGGGSHGGGRDTGNNGGGQDTGTTGGHGSGGPAPTPSPSSGGGTVGQLVGTVDNTVGQVLSILPTPVPTPTPTKTALPLPIPLPSVNLPLPLLPSGH
jgi:hypothetical protein